MQEEVTQRTVALCVEATKLSAGMLQQAMKKVLDEMQKGVTGHKTKLHHGKQTLRQLMKHNTGVSNIEITDQNIRAFSATAKKYGIDSISGGIRELETHGYLVRARVRNENGQLGSIEYTILEQPKEPAQTPAPIREKPIRENPIQVNPMLDAPIQENPAQLNTKEQNKELSITQGSSPIPSSPPTPREKSRSGRDRMRERESYREIILENIDYDILTQDEKLDRDRLDELVELMVDTVCSNREMIRIAGDDYPAEVVKSRFLKIDSSHIEYVLERMRENTTYVRNIKKYLLAALYNAPVTMDSYYTSLVSHDLYGSGDRR